MEEKDIPASGKITAKNGLPHSDNPKIQQLIDTALINRGRPDQPKKVLAARMTVVDRMYYEHPKLGPTGSPSHFQRIFKTVEQPYARWFQVPADKWIPLDLGWLKRVGYLKLENRCDPRIDEPDKHTISIGQNYGQEIPLRFIDVPPGEDCRFQPAYDIYLRLYSPGGAEAFLTLYPE
jgi:hypothetical protein